MYMGGDHQHGTFPQTDRAIRAIRFAILAEILLVTIRAIVAFLGGSAAMAADSFHGLSDLVTTILLGFAYLVAKRSATDRYTYGFHRAEDLVGLVILIFLGISAFLSASTSYRKLASGSETGYLVLGMVVALITLTGKEAIAHYKIRLGREIESISLVADGKHDRSDALTSGGVFLGLFGVWLGYPILDPLFGLAITGAIILMTARLAKDVLARLLDTIDPETSRKIVEVASSVEGVRGVHALRARWAGHRIFCEMHVTVDDDLNICDAHEIGVDVVDRVKSRMPSVEQVLVHLGPSQCDADSHGEGAGHPTGRDADSR
jgi:cation diffusion facilitator family transporter